MCRYLPVDKLPVPINAERVLLPLRTRKERQRMGKTTFFGLSPGTGRETVAATGGRLLAGMTSIRLWLLAAIFVGLAMAMAVSEPNSKADAQTSGTASYTVTDLGTLAGESSSRAEAINESGQVVGYSGSTGFLWQNGSMTDLGTLGGSYSYAYDINDSGQVVGESDYPEGPDGNGPTKAFLWQNGRMTDLGSLLGPPDEESHAYAINNSGQVVGESKVYHPDFGYPDHAFLYSNGVMKDLGILGPSDSPGYSVAYSINGTGEVVGEADLEGFMGTHAFLSDNGSPMADLGTLNGSNYSVAYDINDSGQVVGESQGNSFLWQNGTMSPLGDIEPAAINNDGQVVGEMFVEDPECPPDSEVCGGNVASIHENGQTKNLNDLIDSASGWTLDEATDINDEGQIVGTGTINDEYHAFLLTPDPNTPPADTTDPTVEITTPADGTTYALNEDVKADYTCADEEGGSGLASCAGPVNSGQSIDTSTVGPKSFEVVATDNEGNTATATNTYEVVAPPSDVTPPAITITTPEDDAEYKLGQDLAADYFCSDGGSGVASCVGSVLDGDNLDTASVGSKTFTVNAADVSGNTATVSHDYSVVYDFGDGSGGGFLPPVDNFPEMNSMKAGATVPVKFALGGDQGLDIFAEGYPLSRRISCDTQLPSDPIEETVAASNSGLKYDTVTGHYSYNWKTASRWSGTCRQLTLKLDDGTEHPLNFRFK